MRLLREILQETKDAVGDTCGVGLRIAVDELMGDQGLVAAEEGRDIVEMLAELPDIWDVNLHATGRTTRSPPGSPTKGFRSPTSSS